MTDSFTTVLLDEEVTFARFGALDMMEHFADYASRELFHIVKRHCSTTYCLISGFPVGTIGDEEITALIRSAVVALGLEGLGAGLVRPSDSDVGMAFEMIIDHVAQRVIETSRPAPSLTFSKGKLAIVDAHWTRQLAVLVSTLLYDAGQFRDRELRYTDKVLRIQATIDMATYIRSLESTPLVDELFSALIELDAKYSIRALVFTRKENDALVALREVELPTLEAIHQFALALLARRDIREDEVVDGVLWTQDIYRRRTFEAVDRQAHSNLWKEDKSDPKRYTPESREAKKRGRPASPEVAARKEAEAKRKAQTNKVDAFAAAWGDVFKKKPE